MVLIYKETVKLAGWKGDGVKSKADFSIEESSNLSSDVQRYWMQEERAMVFGLIWYTDTNLLLLFSFAQKKPQSLQP